MCAHLYEDATGDDLKGYIIFTWRTSLQPKLNISLQESIYNVANLNCRVKLCIFSITQMEYDLVWSFHMLFSLS